MARFIYHFRSDEEKLNEMLSLRAQGWSYSALAEKYGCPKLTIRFLARKYGLGESTVTVQFTRTQYIRTITLPPEETTQASTGERICAGKTYAEYLQEEKQRKLTNNVR